MTRSAQYQLIKQAAALRIQNLALEHHVKLHRYHLAKIMMSRWYQRADSVGLGLDMSLQNAGKLFRSVKEC